jgi:hypothetical protein
MTTFRSTGDRGEPRIRLLRVPGRLPICPVTRIKGPRARGDQIRQLIQRRVLLGPRQLGESGEVVLRLLDSGELTEIPDPV